MLRNDQLFINNIIVGLVSALKRSNYRCCKLYI